MRHVIWDWNGTLVDDLEVVVAAVNASLVELGIDPITAEDYRNHYTRPIRMFYDRLLGRPTTDAEWSAIDDTFHTTYADTLDQILLTADAEDAIAAVAATGSTQSILSMWWHDHLVPEVSRHGLDRVMVRVDGNTRDAGETKERLLEIHIAKLGSSGSSVLIGDALDDAHAAIAIGIPCVLYDGGTHHKAELEAVGVPVAGSLAEAVTIALNTL